MDLSNIETKDTIELQIVNPNNGFPIEDDDGNVLTFILYGPESKAQEKYERKMFREVKRAGGVDKFGSKYTYDETQEKLLEQLVVMTAGWYNLEWEGKELEPTNENIRMVYEQKKWIRPQVRKELAKRSERMGE